MSTAVVLAPSIVVVDARCAARTHTACLIRNRWPDARIDEAADGDSALETAADCEADLIVVEEPGESGLALALKLRKARPETQVALVSEPGTAAQRRRADAAGVRLFRAPLTGDVVEQVLALVGWED